MFIIMDSIDLHESVLIFVARKNHLVCATLHECYLEIEMKTLCEKTTVRKRINPKKNVASKNGSWMSDPNTQMSG